MLSATAWSQPLSNARQKPVLVSSDTLQVDTLSIIPGSLYILSNNGLMDTVHYSTDYGSAMVFFHFNDSVRYDSLIIVYRVFPVFFVKEYSTHAGVIKKYGNAVNNPSYIYTPEDRSQELFRIEGLNKSGSISRGITVGNNQDAVVNSSLNLQISGRLSNNINVVAAITDDNIPVQPEGNTQQLQEFDKVFIQLNNDKNKLIAGDFDLKKPEGYFMHFFKKSQGALFSNQSALTSGKNKKGVVNTTISGAVSKGKFARNIFNGTEANQGPYRLRGAENETFIIILSGSERIFIDGELLERGQSNDYTIDYNTAEITFTAKRLITKDSRITIEFQYSDKNYARTMLFGSSQVELDKWKVRLNIYSEQDSKNQPLQQDLDSDQKKLLASIGDNIDQAFSLNIDSVEFNINEVLYARKDTTVDSIPYTNIFVYSTNKDSAHFRLGFSFVGSNKGNYILTTGLANGRVYTWVAPVNKIPQGNYEPVRLLVTPKKRQLLTVGAEYNPTSSEKLSFEFAASKDDINLFSSADKKNDNGFAGIVNYTKAIRVFKNASRKWNLKGDINYEFTHQYFKPVENYRPVEFTRDWNTSSLTDTSDEHIAIAAITLLQENRQSLSYALRTYQKPGSYNGLMQIVSTLNTIGSFKLKTNVSYLTTSGDLLSTVYLRHKEDLAKQWKLITAGISFEEENNRLSLTGTDSLSASSFAFRVAQLYLQRPDTFRLKANVSYSRRWDDALYKGSFTKATLADNLTTALGYDFKNSNRINATITYRKLNIEDTLATSQKADEALLSRLENQLSIRKGFITANVFYEIGTGREQKREFNYVAVAAGTGNYSWIDYNSDGIPQLNEFETAQFQDQANYIRVFIPTTDYIKAFTNQFNLVANIQPSVFQKNTFIEKFSLLSALRYDNKLSGISSADALNPFYNSVDDLSLITTNKSIRQSLFFNRTGRIFSTELTYNDQQTKQLLVNGIETRLLTGWLTNTRINFTPSLNNQITLEHQVKTTSSQAFSNRDFDLLIYNAEEKLSFQPGSNYRITASYQVKQKENRIGELRESSLLQQGGLEFRFSNVKKGLATVSFNLLNIDFNQPENTPLAYEMLEGFKEGINYKWNISLQRNIASGFQLSLNYDGRKSKNSKTIHSGGVQVRAYF